MEHSTKSQTRSQQVQTPVQAHLGIYAAVLWDPHSKQQAHKLKIVQNSAIRFIADLNMLTEHAGLEHTPTVQKKGQAKAEPRPPNRYWWTF